MKKVLAAALLAIAPAHALPVEGNMVWEGCTKSQAIVSGFVVGAMDTMEADHTTVYCMPQGARVRQTRDIFCSYLGQHPELRHLPAVELLKRSLSAAWPCH